MTTGRINQVAFTYPMVTRPSKGCKCKSPVARAPLDLTSGFH